MNLKKKDTSIKVQVLSLQMVGHVWVAETSAIDSYNESQRDALFLIFI